MTRPDAEPIASVAAPAVAAPAAAPAVLPAQPGPAGGRHRPGVLREILGRDADEDRALPDLPPLPADPAWRIEHLPLVTAAGIALVLCAASIGLLAGDPATALGAAAGVLLVTVGITMSTLAIAWADAVRPALVMPVGLLTYVVKYLLIALILVSAAVNGWSGTGPMAWGVAAGAVILTAVQVWWVSRLARRPRRAP
jgi:hypothetical protein